MPRIRKAESKPRPSPVVVSTTDTVEEMILQQINMVQSWGEPTCVTLDRIAYLLEARATFLRATQI